MSKITVTNVVVNTHWCGEPIRAVRVVWDGSRTLAYVDDEDNEVRVLDQHVAKHYTLHHPMSERQKARVRTLLSRDVE